MFEPTTLPGVILITPRVFEDERGFFLETYQSNRYRDGGVLPQFVQDNHSRSSRNVLRGLHYQLRRAQGKLVYVVRGAIWDVAVDIRRGSPTFGKWQGFTLSEENHQQLYIPPGFAHGFCVLSDTADVSYKCTDYYDGEDDRGVLWSDSDLAIQWPVDEPVVSDKDAHLPGLGAIPEDDLPQFKE